jgi:hypothetical protein
MKTLNITIKIITVFLLAGALFFSCTLADPDANGTLIIALPGSGARAATFDEYITTLSYRVICHNALNETGEADEIISKPVSYNKKTSISLAPGAWYVTVEVLDTEKPEGEQVVGEGTTELPVIIESGKTTTAPKITIKIDYDGKEEPIEIKWEWPVKTTWAKYGLSSGLTQPRPTETTVAYVVEGWDSFNLSLEAKKDLGSLPERMRSSIEDMDFLMVKLEFKNADNKEAKDGAYIQDTNSLFTQVDSDKFEKIDFINWTSTSPERWDVFGNSDTVVNLYMNYSGNYIITLAVKEHSWNEIRWGDYGLESFEMPDGARVVYVSYDKDESNKDNSKLQTDYGMRTYENKTFPQFLAVVFLDEGGSIFEQLQKISPFNTAKTTDITNNVDAKYITIVDRQDGTYTRAIDLYKSKKEAYKNYTLITVRQGEKTSTSQSAYW